MSPTYPTTSSATIVPEGIPINGNRIPLPVSHAGVPDGFRVSEELDKDTRLVRITVKADLAVALTVTEDMLGPGATEALAAPSGAEDYIVGEAVRTLAAQMRTVAAKVLA